MIQGELWDESGNTSATSSRNFDNPKGREIYLQADENIQASEGNPQSFADAQPFALQKEAGGDVAAQARKHKRRTKGYDLSPQQFDRGVIETTSQPFQPALLMNNNLREIAVRNPSKRLRERLQRSDVTSFSNVELLTMALGSGSEKIAQQIQQLFENFNLHELIQTDFGDLCHSYGIGEAKAVQLQALMEIARRLTIPSTKEKYIIRSPVDAANLVMPDMAYLDHEELRVLVLDTKNGVVANLLLYQGTVNSNALC